MPACSHTGALNGRRSGARLASAVLTPRRRRAQADIDSEIGSDALLPRGFLPPPRLGLEYRLGHQTRLRRALRSISSTRVLHTSRPGQRGTSAGNQQWIQTSCEIYRSRKALRGNRPYSARNTLRGRPAILNLLTTSRWRLPLPLPPRQLPLLRG